MPKMVMSPFLLLLWVSFAGVYHASSNRIGSNRLNISSLNKLYMYFYGGARQRFPTDCNGVFARGDSRTGVYIIKPDGAKMPYMVRCEMDGAPWTVLLRRFRGSVDFSRTWKEYKKGFGNPESEYWVGNDFMHYLTTQRPYKVRFDMKVWSTGATAYSEFSHFWVGPESGGYQLSINGESGTAKRGGMVRHNSIKFSTKDRDNDKTSGNCALTFPGGWWFKDCYNILFTGPYDTNCDKKCSRWHGGTPLKEMSIRVTRI